MEKQEASGLGAVAVTPSTINSNHSSLPALQGVRFFAVFHIFLFHLSAIYSIAKDQEGTKTMLSSFAQLPAALYTWITHGYLSTSFFFMLSGFILAYVYWTPENNIAGGNKRFWLKRFFRIYPAHLIVLLLCMLTTTGYAVSQGATVFDLLIGAVANITLLQAWYPPFVPLWNWPAWTLSALIFLYLIMPWLVQKLGSFTRKQLIITLVLTPVVSLIPTLIYAHFFPESAKPEQNWQIFIGSTPLFWVAQFASGMLLSRVFGIYRFNPQWQPAKTRLLAWGDLAILAVIAITLIPNITEPNKFFLRHGLMMPLYMVIIIDLARGNGLFAKLFAMRWSVFLGQISFSIFIWQVVVMIGCWMATYINPASGPKQLAVSVIGGLLLSMISTFWIEKPIARKLARRFLGESATNNTNQAA